MLWLSEDKIDVEYQYAIRSLFFFFADDAFSILY